jgi:hypothetical protein
MTIDENGSVDQPSATEHRPRWRRRHAVAGVAGLAVVLGAGAYTLTTQILDRDDPAATRGALAPLVTPPAETPLASPAASSAAASSASASASSVAATSSPSISKTVAERIKAARAAAAKDGHPVQRPLVPTGGMTAQQASVQERTEKIKTGLLRIVSAKFDLSGQRELLWAADDGKAVGRARCTQNFHFSNNAKAAVRPTMLLCWETSAGKSVATVLVDRTGKPSTAVSVAALEREWARLG